MSDEEQKDLARLHEQAYSFMKTAFSGMRNYSRMNAIELSHTGHRTPESAISSLYAFTQKELDKLYKAHIRKYPDAK